MNSAATVRPERANMDAGAAVVEITPRDSQFLYGYPFVRRYSTGVHDRLLSSALYLSDGRTRTIIVASDIIWIDKASVRRIRARISRLTSVPERCIMVTASHTHSGPMTLDLLSNESDPAVPKADSRYVGFLEDSVVAAAQRAVGEARPAEIGLCVASVVGVGTNRRDPQGPTDPEVPVLMVRSLPDGINLACMVVCSMHPTVLHEDSTLVSADFPGMARQFLQREAIGEACPVLYHTGPAGNQSPRHVTLANTFSEAERLGSLLGRAIAEMIPGIRYGSDFALQCRQAHVVLPRRSFPSVERAQAALAAAKQRLARLRAARVPRQEVRTAECDWFGAEETLTLARAAADGRLELAVDSCMPAEIQVIGVGPWFFVGWPGEIFVEYALAVKARAANAHLISLANGELQGYIVTEEAAAEGGYEASNAFFAPLAGQVLVSATLELLEECRQGKAGDGGA